MKHRAFWFLFLLMAATRFGDFFHARPFRAESDGSYGRMYEMEKAGDQLARTGRIFDIFGVGSGPSAHVAPLYPVYLAAIDRLVSFDVGRSRFVQGIGSILATALFAGLLPGLANRAGLKPGVGLGAGLLLVLSPYGLWLEIRGDWETAFLPLGLLLMFRALMALRMEGRDDLGLTLRTGVGFGLAGLLSPVVLLAGLAGLFGQMVEGRSQFVRILRSASIIVVVGALTISPWIYRNYECFGAFVPVRDNFGLELAVGNNPRSDGTTFCEGGMAVHPFGSDREMARVIELGEVRYNRAKLDETKAWIAANPSRFARLTVSRWVHFWFPHDRGMLGPLPYLPVLVQAIALGVASSLAFVGLGWLILTRHPYRWLFLAFLIAPSLPYLVTHVSYRYRFPVNGFVYLLACECLARLIGLVRKPGKASDRA